jgi:hypothetical protein
MYSPSSACRHLVHSWARSYQTALGGGAVNGEAVPVTGRGGLYGCETSRLPRFLDNLLTNGGEVASLTRRPAALYPQEDS